MKPQDDEEAIKGPDENKDETAPEPAAEASADTAMAAENPAEGDRVEAGPARAGVFKRFFGSVWSHKAWTLPLIIISLLGVLLIVPLTRYVLLGTVVKKNFAVVVMDDKTKQPVSSATVSVGNTTALTDNNGRATIKVPVGTKMLKVTKKYYKTATFSVLIPLHQKSAPYILAVQATGRQVPVKVLNKISGAPLANATVSAAGTEATTDKDGKTVIVLPADKATAPATVRLSGYNDLMATITVTEQTVSDNTFAMVPAGKVYFLSNLSGKIDVVKTNLDGSDRQTVLPGTGYENQADTVLMASNDWKYVALMSVRSSQGQPEISLIDTMHGDKVSNIDKGDAYFDLVGWSGDTLVYHVGRQNVPYGQPNAQSLKSFYASSGKLTTLVNTDAYTANFSNYSESIVQYALLDNRVVYVKTWYQDPGYVYAPGQQNKLEEINLDGSGKKTIATQDATQAYFGSILTIKPQQLEIVVSHLNSNQQQFYSYDTSGTYQPDNSFDYGTYLSQPQPAYLPSPSGKQTLWSVTRDGKNVLLVGDDNAAGGKDIASLSEYAPYGWYSDKYVLVSKNGSELYIMPATGGTPLKIVDYYKPIGWR